MPPPTPPPCLRFPQLPPLRRLLLSPQRRCAPPPPPPPPPVAASPGLVSSVRYLSCRALAPSDTLGWNSAIKELASTATSTNVPAHPLSLYKGMLLAGARPDGHTFLYLIKAAAAASGAPRSRTWDPEQIHSHVTKNGFGLNEFVASVLVRFYVAAGMVSPALKLFEEMPHPGLVFWTGIIRTFVNSGCLKLSLELFLAMRYVGLMPDPVALAIVLSACNQTGNFATATAIHGLVHKSGVEIDPFVRIELIKVYGSLGTLDFAYQVFDEMPVENVVVCNAMIHQYAIHDQVDVAFQLFREMDQRDVISWNTMMSGFSQAGRCTEALDLFHEMESSGVRPNGLTLCTVLSICSSLGALETGMWIHAYIEKRRFNVDGALNPSLIDMYAKCGSIEKVLQVLEMIPSRIDLYSWTSTICGLAMHGRANQAIHLFYRMQEESVVPDEITFVGVLNACAHAGLLHEGFRIFDSMQRDYNIMPKIEHYGCMIDLLGRTGYLKEAYNLAIMMPMKPNVVIWGTLLSSCRMCNDVDLGVVVAEKLIELDPSDPWARIMLSNLYAELSQWTGVTRLRKEIKDMAMKKMPGCSSIESNGKVHEFLSGDGLHPQHAEIQSMLELIDIQIARNEL